MCTVQAEILTGINFCESVNRVQVHPSCSEFQFTFLMFSVSDLMMTEFLCYSVAIAQKIANKIQK